MATSDPKNIDQIERILNLPYKSQLKWAAEPRPWEGITLPETNISYAMVSVIDGNVTRMPPLGGRPCFGNPIAWAVHGVVEYLRTRTGLQHTRCGRCKARMGCLRVSEARLSITPEIREAYSNFRGAGGALALTSTHRGTASRMLGELIQRLAAYGPFTSVNDTYALGWPSMRREELRQKATFRKQRERRRDAAVAFRNHEIPDVLSDWMDRERDHRVNRFGEYCKTGKAPLQVTIDPNGNNDCFTADVWLVRERLAIKGQSATPYGIAKEMRKIDRSYDLGFEVLRDRVRKALKRVDLLETTTFPGSADKVWDRFDAKKALIKGLASPPYETV